MSVKERVQWFLQMPPGSYERPSWIAEELLTKIYASGLDRMGKDALSEMVLSCGKIPDEIGTPMKAADVEQMLKDFFAYNDYTADASVKIFALQFTRMELFKTIRHLRSTHGNILPVSEMYRAVIGAAGQYEGGKMASHICPDRFEESVALEKVAEFYFSYEAMLAKDAVNGGVLSNFDIPKELLKAVQDNAHAQVKMLLGHPQADANICDAHETPLLHIAIENQWVEVYNALLEKADPNVRNKDGLTGLHYLLEDGNISMMQSLLRNANVNLPSGDSDNTPLHIAVQMTNDFAVSSLLRAGADKTAKNKDGKTPLELAQEDPEPAIIALLSDAPAEEAPAAE